MVSVSDRTAIEIVSNPRDLLFSVAEDSTEEAIILSKETVKKIVRDLKLKGVAKTYSES